MKRPVRSAFRPRPDCGSEDLRLGRTRISGEPSRSVSRPIWCVSGLPLRRGREGKPSPEGAQAESPICFRDLTPAPCRRLRRRYLPLSLTLQGDKVRLQAEPRNMGDACPYRRLRRRYLPPVADAPGGQSSQRRNPEGAVAEASALSGLSMSSPRESGPPARRLVSGAEAPSTGDRGSPRSRGGKVEVTPRAVNRNRFPVFASFSELFATGICRGPYL